MASTQSNKFQRIVKEYANHVEKNELLESKKRVMQQNLDEARLFQEQYHMWKQGSRTFKPTKAWRNNSDNNNTGVAAEKFLKTIALPMDNGMAMHGYEIDLPTDRLWVKENGSVYSTNQSVSYGWKFKNNRLELLDKPNGSKVLGYIIKSGNTAVFKETEESKRAREAEKAKANKDTSGIDRFQLVLDYAGVIPIIGDAIDIINAAIYFIRATVYDEDKWTDFFLSLIAIIPVVGSVIKLGAKSIYKVGSKAAARLTKLIKSSKTIDGAKELWLDLMKNGILQRGHLSKLGSGLEYMESVLKTSYSGIKKIPGADSKKIIQQLDNFIEWLKTQRKGIDSLNEIEGAIKKAGDKAETFWKIGIGAKLPEKLANPKFLLKASNALTGGVLNKILKSFWFPTKKLELLAKGITKRFYREMASEPTKLAYILRTTTNQSKFLTELSDEFLTIAKNMPFKAKNELERVLKAHNLPSIISTSTLKDASAETMEKFLRIIKETPDGAEFYKVASNRIISNGIENDSMVWALFKNDTLNNLYTLFSRDMIDNSQSILKQINISFAKNADIIWDELQDIWEDLDITSKDEVNGIIYPVVKSGLKKIMGADNTETGKAVVKKTAGDFGVPVTKKLYKMAKDAVGLGGAESYNPEQGKGGQYK